MVQIASGNRVAVEAVEDLTQGIRIAHLIIMQRGQIEIDIAPRCRDDRQLRLHWKRSEGTWSLESVQNCSFISLLPVTQSDFFLFR